jgi:phosphoadenosine phosphosulfate reductase
MSDSLIALTKELVTLLRRIAVEHSPAVFANSFGAEDMVLTHLIATEQISIPMFAIDTGRLPTQTYALMGAVEDRYGLPLGLVFPEREGVEAYVSAHGINGFYTSIELRKQCCQVRKLEPLRRALSGKAAWVTGLRSAQAATRQSVAIEAWDESHSLLKFNPLAAWSKDDVWDFLRANDVPFNSLHEQGFPSIGCAPCTRAIHPGEDIRAGRWWWEAPETKECGLHWADGKLQRNGKEAVTS